MAIPSSRKKTPLNSEINSLFFSLVDYRNNYFISDETAEIIKFYNGFENRDQLVQWMKERPKGIANIIEVDGDKEVIVVIPTADFNGNYAKNCRENIFKGLHIIFVESGEVPDPYFNYAHNCNVGIKKAMVYNPNWVVISNDDMQKIDDIRKLLGKLNRVENKIGFVAFADKSFHHTKPELLVPVNMFVYFYYLKNKSFRILNYLIKYFDIKYVVTTDKLVKRVFFKKIASILELNDFAIFSADIIEENKFSIFDEIFINHFEDTDLSLRISYEKKKTLITNFKIGSIEGGTFGKDSGRYLRSIASLAYFTSKYEKCDLLLNSDKLLC